MKSFYAGKSLFTWAGAKVNRTITLMCKLRVHQDVDYNNLMIYGMSPKHISVILSQPKPSSDELAALVPREDKEEQNYQHVLSDERLNHEYASTYLDVEKLGPNSRNYPYASVRRISIMMKIWSTMKNTTKLTMKLMKHMRC